MENAKQKAIRLAYGEYWEQVKDYVDENGYCNKRDLFQNKNIRYEEINLPFTHHTDFTMCPKSLQGIENNNGWIRIESEKDLPSENNLDCYVFRNDEIEMATFDNETKKFYDFETSYDRRLKYVTHYQPIIKPLKPIY